MEVIELCKKIASLIILSIWFVLLSMSSYATQVGSLTGETDNIEFDSVDDNATSTDNIEHDETEYLKDFNVEVVDDRVITNDSVNLSQQYDGQSSQLVVSEIVPVGDEQIFAYYVHNQSNVGGTLLPVLTLTVTGQKEENDNIGLVQYHDNTSSIDEHDADSNSDSSDIYISIRYSQLKL